MSNSLSPIIRSPVGVTSHTTPLAIRRGAGGEAGPVGVTSHTTPPPAQLDLGEATMSTFFTRHAPLFLRQGRTGREERRFYIQEQAFLEARGA